MTRDKRAQLQPWFCIIKRSQGTARSARPALAICKVAAAAKNRSTSADSSLRSVLSDKNLPSSSRVYRRATEGKQVVLQEDAAIYTLAAGTVTAQAAARREFQVAVSRTEGKEG